MNIKQLAESPAAFRDAILIDTPAGPMRLGPILDDWQRADFESLDPAWMTISGRGSPASPRLRAYLERPRGHSKTNDIALAVTWALFASRRTIRGVIAAADRDQATLLRNAIARLVRLNPWLSERTDSELVILSSDAASSYGLTPSFVLCDELTHWPERAGEDLWTSLFSSAGKTPNCLLTIISNAGTGEGASWQWKVREAARTDPQRWLFSRLDGPVARWIDAETLAEQRRLLPDLAYRRLWLNEWTSGVGEALP